MDAGFLDVLHDPGDVDGFAVADAVDIDLDRVVQIAIDQHGPTPGHTFAGHTLARHAYRLAHVTMQAAAIVDDFHRPSAQYITGPNHDWKPNTVGDLLGIARGSGDTVFGLQQAQPLQQKLEAFAVLGYVDGIG